jgi:hypothetical protein
MQTNCSCLNWAVTENYPDAQSLDEFLSESEEADEYTRPIPTRIWRSDSTLQYYYVSEALTGLVSIDELGLTKLPDSCYFASISPSRVQKVLGGFKALDFSALGVLHERTRAADVAKKWPDVQAEFVRYLEQWRDGLAFAEQLQYGLIGSQG